MGFHCQQRNARAHSVVGGASHCWLHNNAWAPVVCNTMLGWVQGVIWWDSAGGTVLARCHVQGWGWGHSAGQVSYARMGQGSVARCHLPGWQLGHSASQMSSAGMVAGVECCPGIICCDGREGIVPARSHLQTYIFKFIISGT